MIRGFLITLIISHSLLSGCAKGDKGCFDFFGMPALTDCDKAINDPEKQDLCLLWLTLYQRCRK